ncbi:MBL fold metallo-hydrolase [Actinomadura violacea]|uniref:MBL fold metallo-hydrolase n=1 Tax=Actinomadura violacea TaxID=2819934 RepID=A0ABS3RXR2_9ACTN|nr:MBL fold metallo-hydrolase [Actinomadura violacea]MBO2461549.1 MBL fold metallo-hydrolase [Actinomadura violacea]
MPSDLELTFLGHQTWHIATGNATVLLDPILKPAFGAGTLDFRIWPPRQVDTDAMPAPAAVVLSHEHLDHLHLPSLDLLDRTVPVYTGHTVPHVVSDAIEHLGFEVRRVDHSKPIRIGDLEITLYPAGARTMFWENRVVQPLVRSYGGREVFIGVDADVSDLYLEDIAAQRRPVPYMAVVSNNSQTVPYGALGADTNLLPGIDGPRKRRTGIEVLHSLLIDYLKPLDGVAEVALCGNGFTAPRSPHGPFLYADHRKLAEQANALQHLFRVHGPRPGDRITIPAGDAPAACSRVPWVTIDEQTEAAKLAELEAFVAAPVAVEPTPITGPLSGEQWGQARSRVAKELQRLATDLISTRTGALAIGIHDYLSGPLGSERLVLRLLDPPGKRGSVESYAWDVSRPSFERVTSTSRDEAMTRYPFGIEIYYQDYVAVLEGHAQIWDVVGGSYQGWNIGDPLDSPVYALFAVYGEHQRPDLAARVYDETVKQMRLQASGAVKAGR